MKKAAIFGVIILSLVVSGNLFLKSVSAQSSTPSCTGISVVGANSTNLLSGRTYTLQGSNCVNATSYQWNFGRGNCSGTTFPSTATTATVSLTMPTLSYSGQQCFFDAAMRVCNGSNCSQYYTLQPTVKYALPEDAKQWTFNVNLSCQNGATPIDVNVNTSWNFLNQEGSTSCQPNSGENRGSTRSTLTFSESFSSAPSLCSQGIYNISKLSAGESTIFKDASSNLITAKADDPGTATWSIANLPAGSYTLNYYLPLSSCPAITATTGPTPIPRPSPCNGMGDVNLDGFVTSADNLLTARHLAGLDALTDEQKRRADVTNDGRISLHDSLAIARFAAGLDNTFPVCPSVTVTNTPQICDPDPNGSSAGKLDNQDLAVIRNELLELVNTNRGACLNNAPNNTSSSKTDNTALARIRNILLELENPPQ